MLPSAQGVVDSKSQLVSISVKEDVSLVQSSGAWAGFADPTLGRGGANEKEL